MVSGQLPEPEVVHEFNPASGTDPDGEAEPGGVLAIDRDLADEYFQEEDQRVTMAELAMQ